MPKHGTSIIGACGEHYVAAYLSGHQLLVALPRAGVKASDLFVAEVDSGRPLRVQVKTGTDSKRKQKGQAFFEWQAKIPTEKNCNSSSWFAFVWLNKWPMEIGPPEMFFVPSTVVFARMQEQYTGKTPTYPTFWMWSSELEQYRNQFGLQLMRQSMVHAHFDQ